MYSSTVEFRDGLIFSPYSNSMTGTYVATYLIIFDGKKC